MQTTLFWFIVPVSLGLSGTMANVAIYSSSDQDSISARSLVQRINCLDPIRDGTTCIITETFVLKFPIMNGLVWLL